MEAVYEELAENQKLEMQSKNWERVFDLTPLNNDWATRGASIQAPFWELKKEHIRNVRFFEAATKRKNEWRIEMAYNVGEIYEIFDKLDIEDKRKIIKDLQAMLEVAEAEPELRGLEKDWDEIQKNIWSLSREPYIDDQWEIEEVWNITEKLLKSKYFKKEPWELRKKILADIIENEFYDYYGVIDPMMDLFKALCFTDEEKLECADMTFSFGSEWMKSYGAVIYRECGRPKKYYDYLEKRLGREQQPYVELIEYYKDKDPDKAAKIATLGMEKCKDHQTECCIYLMQKAKAEKDEAQFEKLLKSARLRMSIDYEKVASSFGIESKTKRAGARLRSK